MNTIRLLLPALAALTLCIACEDNDETPANQPPQLSDRAFTLSEQTPDTLDFGGSDPEGAALVYEILEGPAHGTLTGLVLVPDSGFVGTDQLRVRAFDGQDSSRVATMTLEVLGVNGRESATILGESMALLTGGALESLEAVASLSVVPEPPATAAWKARFVDEAVFDPDSCIWSLADQRDHQGSTGDPQGFQFEEDWRVWLRDAQNECLEFADTTLRWMDMRRDFTGSGWNQVFRGSREGRDEFHLTEFNAGPAGMLVDGRHERRGDGELLRDQRWVEHEFELELEFEAVRILPVGNRLVPVAGEVSVQLKTERDGVEVRRSGVIQFSEPGRGAITFDDGDEWIMDTFTGAVNPAQ